jgi:hypothetical protein
MSLSLRNHYLGLTQSPGKSNHGQEQKREQKENENHSFKIGTPEGKRRIWASIPTKKHRKNTTMNFLIFRPLS